MPRTRDRYAWPASVSESRRVVRCSRRVPRWFSRSATRRVTTGGDMSSARRRGEAALVHDLLEHPHREETVHRDGIRSISLRGFYVAVTVPFPRGRRLVPERKFNLQPRIEGSNMTRSTSSLLALALALSAGSAMAAGTGLVNNETGQGVVAEPIVVVSKTRQQVRHELAEALHRGEVIVNNATGETL